MGRKSRKRHMSGLWSMGRWPSGWGNLRKLLKKNMLHFTKVSPMTNDWGAHLVVKHFSIERQFGSNWWHPASCSIRQRSCPIKQVMSWRPSKTIACYQGVKECNWYKCKERNTIVTSRLSIDMKVNAQNSTSIRDISHTALPLPHPNQTSLVKALHGHFWHATEGTHVIFLSLTPRFWK